MMRHRVDAGCILGADRPYGLEPIEETSTVTATTPQATVQMADDAFNRGDLDGMLQFYEETAVMQFDPRESIRGKAAIRQALTPLLAMHPIAAHEDSHVIEAGDLALWTSTWSVKGTAPDGSAAVQQGTGSVILRRGQTAGGGRH